MGEGNTILTRFFTQNSLQDILSADGFYSELMHQIVRRYSIHISETSCNGEVISEIYRYVGKKYRNEYFYKNTLLNKLIINVHRVNTTTALTEIPVAKSKADFVMINGKAVVYEIKTELDTFERLSSQVEDYFKAFDHVCVVTSENQLADLQQRLGESPVGIYILTPKNTLKRIKEPIEYRESLDPQSIFKVLNKPEYESIVLQTRGELPNVTPVNYYKACKQIVCSIPTNELYQMFLKELKKRNKIEVIDYSNIPEALHFLVYFSKHRQKDAINIQRFLPEEFKGG